jgi:hypothetical protein
MWSRRFKRARAQEREDVTHLLEPERVLTPVVQAALLSTFGVQPTVQAERAGRSCQRAAASAQGKQRRWRRARHIAGSAEQSKKPA